MNKPWYLSKTIIGGIIALVGGVLHAAGISDALTDTQQQAELVELFLEVTGFVLVLIGRKNASGDITIK